ncbi:MAG: hypothetical protein ACRDQ7_07350 [Haloechinothrix sp.]
MAVALTGLSIVSSSAAGGSVPSAQQQEQQQQRQEEEGCSRGLKVSMDVKGTSRIAKLGSRITIGPGRFDGVICEGSGDDPRDLDIEGDLTLPSSDGYFVIFGFMPSTNTTDFVQDGKVKGTTRLDLPNMSSDVDMVAKLFIRVRDVKQDGVPINVGDDCRTAQSAVIPIKGKVNLEPGAESVIKSRYEIPRFTGCGVTENLNPLITGLVSGPDNLLTSRMKMRCIGCTD